MKTPIALVLRPGIPESSNAAYSETRGRVTSSTWFRPLAWPSAADPSGSEDVADSSGDAEANRHDVDLGLLFVRTDDDEVRTVHVHVVAETSVEWSNYLRFRDLLRGDAKTREAYEQVKRDAVARFADDRSSYAAAKHEVIQRVLSLE